MVPAGQRAWRAQRPGRRGVAVGSSGHVDVVQGAQRVSAGRPQPSGGGRAERPFGRQQAVLTLRGWNAGRCVRVRAGTAQWAERRAEMPGAILTRVRF